MYSIFSISSWCKETSSRVESCILLCSARFRTKSSVMNTMVCYRKLLLNLIIILLSCIILLISSLKKSFISTIKQLSNTDNLFKLHGTTFYWTISFREYLITHKNKKNLLAWLKLKRSRRFFNLYYLALTSHRPFILRGESQENRNKNETEVLWTHFQRSPYSAFDVRENRASRTSTLPPE